ncbi:MAG: caspase family protein [Pseudanabaena sp. ELA645]|jgi:WD40 repeat protein/Cdc6-like AAA superfamily ATPase
MARYALVIGVAKYKSPLGNLSKTEYGAKAIADVLNQYGNFAQVHLLTGDVTTETLEDTLHELLTNSSDHHKIFNEIFIFYVGHAVSVRGSFGKKHGYLALSDTLIKTHNTDNTGIEITGIENAIALDDLNALIRESNLSSLLFLLDACHRDLLLEASQGFLQAELICQIFGETFGKLKQNYFLLTTYRKFEDFYTNNNQSCSTVKAAVLQSLSSDRADNRGVVDVRAMFTYVAAELQGMGQEVVLYGNGKPLRIVDYGGAETEVEDICPYMGLNPFDKNSAQWFFGRDRTFSRLMQKINQSSTHNQFLFLIGASGSGKSSLVKAKLIPEMHRRGYEILQMLPWTSPIQNLKGILSLVKEKTLLVIDRFEELFTLCEHESERNQFIERLLEISENPDSDIIIIATMRTDFLAECNYPNLDKIINEQMVWLPDLTSLELKAVIAKPAEIQGYQLGEGLLEAISGDIPSQPNYLPLLQFTLQQLWKSRDRQNRLLSLESYHQIKGLKGALDDYAEKIYALQTDLEKAWMRNICLKLVSTKNNQDIRQSRQTLVEMANDIHDHMAIENVLRSLIEAELVILSEENQVETITLAQKVLIEAWSRFKEWLLAERDLRRLGDRIQSAWQAWENHDRHVDYLLSNSLILELREHLRKHWQNAKSILSPTLQNYYQQSEQNTNDKIVLVERKLMELQLREQVIKIADLLPTQPSKALQQTIEITETYLNDSPPEVIVPVQSLLRSLVEVAREKQCWHGHEQGVWAIAISPDGKYIVSGSDDQTLRLWDWQGNQIGIFQGHEQAVRAVAFSPDGKQIISGSTDQTLRLWDLQGNQIGEPFEGHEQGIWSVAFSPDGQKIVSGGDDQTLRLWDLAGNQIGEPFQGHENWVWSVAFSPDGNQIISGSNDQTLRLWNLQGNQIGEPFRGHEHGVWAIAFSPDGKYIISGSSDQTLQLWDLQGHAIGEPFQGHENWVRSVAFSPDGKRIISGSDDQTIRLWDLQGNQIGEPLYGHQQGVRAVALSNDGRQIISGSDDRTLREWETDGYQIGGAFQGHEHGVWAIAISPDGEWIVSGSNDQTLRLWNWQGNQIREPFKGHENGILAVAISPNGRQIVSGSADNTICLWDLEGNQIRQFLGHENWVRAIAISPDGQYIISGSSDQTLRLWDFEGNQIGEPFQGHEQGVWNVAFSPDGQQIISGGADHRIRLWDLEGKPIGKPFEGHENWVCSVTFSPDGQRIISGSADRTIRLWDLQGNQIGEPFQGHENWVRTVAVSPDGKQIISGSDDQTIRLWDFQGNQIGQPFQGHKHGVRAIAFSLDGKQIISGSDDQTLRVWRGGDWADWLAICRDRLQDRISM